MKINEEDVELIKPKSKKKQKQQNEMKDKFNKYKNYISPILMGIIGLVLCTNSNDVIISCFYIIGAIIIGFGGYNIYGYLQIKKQLKITDEIKLNTGIVSCAIGLLIVILASVINTFLNLIIGFWLILTAVTKLKYINKEQKINKKEANLHIVQAGILILMGLYTIFFQNIILTIVGIWMIISAGIELFTILKK